MPISGCIQLVGIRQYIRVLKNKLLLRSISIIIIIIIAQILFVRRHYTIYIKPIYYRVPLLLLYIGVISIETDFFYRDKKYVTSTPITIYIIGVVKSFIMH